MTENLYRANLGGKWQESTMERRLAAVMAADMVGYSRLMENDADDILARQKAYRRELIDPEIDRNRGRIVKTTGDGMLAEFASAKDAVRCAIDIQSGMALREMDHDPDIRIQYRVGVNLGDIIFDENDIFGDGVNVASRLEGLAEPGGICISDSVLQSVAGGITEPFRDMGGQRVKNISRPIRVWQWTLDAPGPRQVPTMSDHQQVKFCASTDGTHIAYASVGDGPVVLKAPNWLNHIEYEWSNPIWGPFLTAFSSRTRFVRFDQRGGGLSDWDVSEISPQTMLQDMEAVVEAAGIDRFALYGTSQGASFAIDYALKHPEKVNCIVFFGGYLRGRLNRGDSEQKSMYDMACTMIREGWGSTNPLFRQFFTSSFMPESGPDQQTQFDELQRIATNPDNALRLFEMNARINMIDKARQLDVPVLVLHANGDKVAPIEEGRLLARTIPGALFMELPGANHIVIEGTPTFDRFFEEAIGFINRHQ